MDKSVLRVKIQMDQQHPQEKNWLGILVFDI